MTLHTVRFLRSTGDTKEYRALCTCGWAMQGPSLEEIQGRAATHDLDDFKEHNEALLEKVPFVTGLSKEQP